MLMSVDEYWWVLMNNDSENFYIQWIYVFWSRKNIIGNEAFTAMQTHNQSQSIIITGESGAGKTESTKHLLQYLCFEFKSNTVQKIIDADPIMEAFGIARTEINDRSSRYCRYLQVTSWITYFSKNRHKYCNKTIF